MLDHCHNSEHGRWFLDNACAKFPSEATALRFEYRAKLRY